MASVVNYIASDYDESAHRASIRLDLQAIDLPDSSLDIVLTSHVLEHVPDTAKALKELFRVVRPGGRVFLMVPMPQGRTAPPTQPEYHGDNTLVYWRFGWDLDAQIERSGFLCEILVTDELRRRVVSVDLDIPYEGADCDVGDLLAHAPVRKLRAVANDETARRFGFLPPFHFIVWQCLHA
jgi:SAM-dependent methyltransferase